VTDLSYVRLLEQRIERLERAIRLQFALSRSTAAAVDTGPVQTNQGKIDALSLRDGMPTLFTYGFSSSLPVGGDKAVMFLGGNRSQAVVVATGHQTYRFTGLKLGETVMHDMWEHSIHMTADGIAVAGNLTLAGNLTVTGTITATGDITAGAGGAGAVTVLTHKHTSAASGSPTSAPIAGT
jgi:phage gp45-like